MKEIYWHKEVQCCIIWIMHGFLPHCHYAPKEWKRNLVHRIRVRHKGYSKRVNPEAVIGIRADCCRYGAGWVDDTGTLWPSHRRLRPIRNRNGATHIYKRTIGHGFTLFVYARLHSLHSEQIPNATGNLQSNGRRSLLTNVSSNL